MGEMEMAMGKLGDFKFWADPLVFPLKVNTDKGEKRNGNYYRANFAKDPCIGKYGKSEG